MKTLEQVKSSITADYLATLAPLPAPVHHWRNAMHLRRLAARDMEAQELVKAYMRNVVCHWSGFGEPIEIIAPLTFDDVARACSTIGGGVIALVSANADNFRATVEATRCREWVLVNWQNEYVAMTVEQAFERGLREAVWPGDSRED